MAGVFPAGPQPWHYERDDEVVDFQPTGGPPRGVLGIEYRYRSYPTFAGGAKQLWLIAPDWAAALCWVILPTWWAAIEFRRHRRRHRSSLGLCPA